MDGMLDWLTTLPPAALYLALAAAAALESFFPPLPSDTVVAFGSFLAARGGASVIGAFLATWVGSVSGAMTVYALGRRYASGETRQWLLKYGGARARARIEALYARHGTVALFLSRFLPGIRAIVPPFAGALRTPPIPVAAAIAVASGIWYGIVTIVAYRVGADWDTLRTRLTQLSLGLALAAGAATIILLATWLLYRRARQS